MHTSWVIAFIQNSRKRKVVCWDRPVVVGGQPDRGSVGLAEKHAEVTGVSLLLAAPMVS